MSSLVTDATSEKIRQHMENAGVELELGAVERSGALGTMQPLCSRDPDGNLIEVSTCVDHTE